MSVCMNCNTHGVEDMDVISHLIKIRLKPKVLLNHYMLCVRCGAGGGWRGGRVARRAAAVRASALGSPCVQGAAERAQGQPGHHHQVRGLQRALQRPEPQQHADPLHGAAAQLGAGAEGRAPGGRVHIHWNTAPCAGLAPSLGRGAPGQRGAHGVTCTAGRLDTAGGVVPSCVGESLAGGRGPSELRMVASDFRSGPERVQPSTGVFLRSYS